MSRFKNYLEKLGIEPRDISIYRRAMTHISAAKDPEDSYERLEFLGDSIIGMVISDFLFRKFPEKEEGDLSRIKATVVSGETLGAKALELGLDKYLRGDTLRMREGGQAEFSILADSFEAMVGAVFADRGYRQAQAFVLRNLRDECIRLRGMHGPADYKSRLQELWQERLKMTPDYEVISEVGPDHEKIFTVEVKYHGEVLGTGQGSSKKRAEQEAAMEAFENEMKKTRKKGSKKL